MSYEILPEEIDDVILSHWKRCVKNNVERVAHSKRIAKRLEHAGYLIIIRVNRRDVAICVLTNYAKAVVEFGL